ncbi:MAG: hypothetical protein NTY19_11640, partial [Planctomycetota bacterium]|nr:hypothetical protein [Planctomycetota bacterium]
MNGCQHATGELTDWARRSAELLAVVDPVGLAGANLLCTCEAPELWLADDTLAVCSTWLAVRHHATGGPIRPTAVFDLPKFGGVRFGRLFGIVLHEFAHWFTGVYQQVEGALRFNELRPGFLSAVRADNHVLAIAGDAPAVGNRPWDDHRPDYWRICN